MIARRIVTAILSHGREIFAWAMYDWANSAYTSFVDHGARLLHQRVCGRSGDDCRQEYLRVCRLAGLGSGPKNCGALVWSWGISLSMFTAALVSPFIGAMADARASKSRWLAVTALTGRPIGVVRLAPYGTRGPDHRLFLFVSLMFELSFGFYKRLSARTGDRSDDGRSFGVGLSLGYVGGGIALSLEFLVLAFGARIGLSEPVDQLRVGLLIMGVWWGLFSLPAVLILRDRALPRAPDASFGRTAINAVGEVTPYADPLEAVSHAGLLSGRLLVLQRRDPDGHQSVADLCERDLNFTAQELLVLILAFQFICLPGAMIVAR